MKEIFEEKHRTMIVKDIVKEYNISPVTWYNWLKKYNINLNKRKNNGRKDGKLKDIIAKVSSNNNSQSETIKE